VQSEQMKKDIVYQGIPSDKVTPVPMAIDLDDYFNNSDAAGNDSGREAGSIIYLGTMQKLRRIDFVLRVFRLVLDSMPEAKLYMVGSSENIEDMEFLKEEAKRLKVDHATVFTGNLPRLSALQVIKRSAVGVSPFFPTPVLNSTSPTKLIEYMSMGTPAVANDHPEQRQTIEESKAGYCVPYNETAFAQSILKLLKNPEKAAKMGKNGVTYVLTKRNYKIVADSLESQYRTVLS
jgi:glycosyltransferase involved in cell wall biosynthesis